jgi:stage II sporulation protein D
MRSTHEPSPRNSSLAAVSGSLMRPTVLLAALAALLATVAATPALGASRLVVRGAGFGHGIGMSQYGAFGFAQQGSDHAAILAHYYTGTALARLDGTSEVRVLLKTAGRVVVRNASSVVGVRALDPNQRYVATRGLSGVITLSSSSGRTIGSYRSPLVLSGANGGFRLFGTSANGVKDGTYRGNLEVRASSLGGVSAINALNLEDYVRGVVAGEMPSGWPQEALRAQADAARTYALATTKAGDGFDQYADTRSQVYDGIAGETAPTDAAVAATAGEIVSFQGKPIVTYYFSTSGGQTENIENVFLGAQPEPYLVSVDDPYDGGSPRHRWVRQMSLASAQRKLGSLVKGSLTRIRVITRGRSPRVVRAQVVGTGGRTNVTGPDLRGKLGLYDTWARFTVITATGRRGDGNTPPSVAPTPAVPGNPTTGGAAPAMARAAAVGGATAFLPAAGVLSGRVDPAIPGRSRVTVQQRLSVGWVSLFEAPVGAGGRYVARLARPGLYRVRFDGVAGPNVLVR